MIISSEQQLVGLKQVGQLVADVWLRMQAAAQPGMTTWELDQFGAQLLAEAGADSAPSLCYDFPGATCISVNAAAAHGIPDDTPLCAGDLINIDVSAQLNGLFADTGGSFVLHDTAPSLKQRLCDAAKRARDCGVAYAQAGRPLNLLGRRIHHSIRASGFCNVTNLCGHGVGIALHEEPTIRNYYDPRDNQLLQRGQVITIEPFLATNVSRVRTAADGWTLLGRSSSLFAQFEHTLVITDSAPIILTLPSA